MRKILRSNPIALKDAIEDNLNQVIDRKTKESKEKRILNAAGNPNENQVEEESDS